MKNGFTRLIATFVFGLSLAIPAGAVEYSPLFRSSEIQAMGGAVTAYIEDDRALFYNPAGLVGIKDMTLNIATADAEVSNQLVDNMSLLTAMAGGSFSASTLNDLVAKKLYLRTQGVAIFSMPNVALGAIGDYQAAIRLTNKAYPMGHILSKITYGGQVGIANQLFKFRKNHGELRMGLAPKLLFRAGGTRTPTILEWMTLNYQSLASNLDTYGIGYGADLGMQFIYRSKRRHFSLFSGLVWKDMGDTSFTQGAESIKSNLVFGLAATYHRNDMDITLAYDVDHIADYMDWRRKTHIGLKVAFPGLQFFGGLNQFQATFGASIDLWLVRVTYSNYAEDIGTVWGQSVERRQMGHVSMKISL